MKVLLALVLGQIDARGLDAVHAEHEIGVVARNEFDIAIVLINTTRLLDKLLDWWDLVQLSSTAAFNDTVTAVAPGGLR